jgi:RNA polymerase sigma-B factor
LDADPSGGEGTTSLADRLGSQDPAFAAAEARAMLVPVIRSLTERERLVLELRFFRGCTQSEIGRRLGVTQTQVSRVLSGLLSRLREQLTVNSAHAA